ncbi:hypothetical protein B0T18DRAFT_143920 [Schizothecium vesticola]|uniref:Uncharacterized protein n=1 Tax=Schizothecium vesticola TaxID=314040 RepID=A0AA40EVA1_9PEZI|nr:hypothetical protein B0T18DRAFT_143920 [Schizothecium vesticola]
MARNLLVTSAANLPFASASSSQGCQAMSDGWCARFQSRHLVVPLHREEAGNQDQMAARSGRQDIEAASSSPRLIPHLLLLERSRLSSALAPDLRCFGSSSSSNTTPWSPTTTVVKKGVACAARVLLRASKFNVAPLPILSSDILASASVFAPNIWCPAMSERKTSPANAALVRQASGPPDPPVLPWPLAALREDRHHFEKTALWMHSLLALPAARAASAGTDSWTTTHVNRSPSLVMLMFVRLRGGSLPPSNLTRPIRFQQRTATLNANGRAPLSPTTGGGGKELPSPSTNCHWALQTWAQLCACWVPGPGTAQEFLVPHGLDTQARSPLTTHLPPLLDPNPSPPPPSHLRLMRCPAPPSSAQTHACPRASKYLFHDPSPEHCIACMRPASNLQLHAI